MTNQLYATGGRRYVVKAQNSHAIPQALFTGNGRVDVIRDFESFQGWENYFDFNGLENTQALPQFGNGTSSILGSDSAHSGSHPSITDLASARLNALDVSLEQDSAFQADFAAARGGDAQALDHVLSRYASEFRVISFDIQMKSTGFMDAGAQVGRLIYNSGQRINGVPSELAALQNTQTWVNATPEERASALTDPNTRGILIQRHNASVMNASLTAEQEKIEQTLINLGGGSAMAHTDGTEQAASAVKALAAYADANNIDMTQPQAAENLIRTLNIQANDLNGNTARWQQLTNLQQQWLAAPPEQQASITTQIDQIKEDIAANERASTIAGLAQNEFNDGLNRTVTATARLSGVWGGVWDDVVNGKIPVALLGVTVFLVNQIILNQMAKHPGETYEQAALDLGIHVTPEAIAHFAADAGVNITVTAALPVGLLRNAFQFSQTAEAVPAVMQLAEVAYPNDPTAHQISQAGRDLEASPYFQSFLSFRDTLPLALSAANAYRISNGLRSFQLPTNAGEVQALVGNYFTSLQAEIALAAHGQLDEAFQQQLEQSLATGERSPSSTIPVDISDYILSLPTYSGELPPDGQFWLPPGFTVHNGQVLDPAGEAAISLVATNEDSTLKFNADGTYTPSQIISLSGGGRVLRIDISAPDQDPQTPNQGVLVITLKPGVSANQVLTDFHNDPDHFLGDLADGNLDSHGVQEFQTGAPSDGEGLVRSTESRNNLPSGGTNSNELLPLPPQIAQVVLEQHNAFFDFFREIGEAFQQIPAGQLGSILGSNLARLVHTDDPWQAVGVGTLLSTIGLNIGQGISNLLDQSAETTFANAFADFPTDIASAGLGAISSYLLAEWVNDQGLGDFGAGAVNSETSAIVGRIADNLAHLGQPLAEGGTRLWSTGLTDVGLYLNAAGSFLGTYLASELVQFDSIGGQIGASIGSAIGGLALGGYFGGAVAATSTATGIIANFARFIGGTFAGPVGAFLGAFIGYLVGGLIGSMFGGTPKAGAALSWDASDQQFEVAGVWSKSGGSKDAVRSMAGQVGQLLNGVIAATGSTLSDPTAVQAGAYDLKGGRFIYKPSAAGNYAYESKDISKVVTHGSFIALSDLSRRLLGGDVYVKRALAATLQASGGNADDNNHYSAGDFDVQTLFGNISTAQDYESYLQNAAMINALISADPRSAFTAGWTTTFALAMELGLDRRGASDWTGGWAAFLDESADGKIDGGAFTPADVSLQLDLETNERLFSFSDENGDLLGVLGDTIDSASKTSVTGGAGADTITLSSSNVSGWRIDNTTGLTINGTVATGAPSDQIRVAAVVDAGAGDDTVVGGDLGNDLLGGDGDDTLIGGELDDWEFGGAGNDKLFAGDVSSLYLSTNVTDAQLSGIDGGNGDYLDGGDGNDILYGGQGSDWLAGGAGVDRIIGGDGGDILDGGAGDDQGANGAAAEFGGAGSDQYIFNRGSGIDVIYDDSDPSEAAGANLNSMQTRYAQLNANPGARNWAGGGDYTADGSVVGGEDAIAFGAGIGFENLKMTRSVVGGVATSDLIIEIVDDVNGALVATGDKLVIKDWFDDKRKVEWFRFADGQDIRIGDVSSFTIGTQLGDSIVGTNGNDWVVGLGGGDDIKLLNGDDFGFGGKGNDIIAGDGDNDFVSGGDDADQVVGGAGNDTVFGDAGNDVVSGDAGDDIVAGGRGNDIVNGGAGDDLYRYWRGDGHDTVIDSNPATSTQDVYANGQFVNGYDMQDLLAGEDWAVSLEFDAATQKFKRRLGAATPTNAGANDRIEFGFGIDIEDVELRRASGDLELAIAGGASNASAFEAMSDGITFTQWFSGVKVEHFVFTELGDLNVSSWNLAADATGATSTDGDDTIAGTSGIDWYTGGLGDDTLSGAGSDDILSGNFGADHISGGAGADIIYGGADNDVLEGGADADQIFGGDGEDIASYVNDATGIRVSLVDQYVNTLEAKGDKLVGIEGLEGGSGADQLYGDAGDNMLRGNAGNDVLKGSAGDDTYEINANQGDDTISEYDVGIEEIIDANGQLKAGYTLTWDLVDIQDLFGAYWYRYSLSVKLGQATIYQSRPNDFKYGGEVADAPPPGSWPYSNGQWVSGAYRTGNGVQTVRETANAGDAGFDTLELGENISLSDIIATRLNSGADLKLSFAGSSATIVGQSNSERSVEALVLNDGLTANLLDLKLGTETGGAHNDLYLGGAGNDVFDGHEGDDVISGGAGADTLTGGAGDDTLEGGSGGDVLDGGADSVTADHAAIQGDATGAYGDTIRYVRSSAGVTIDLAAATASGGDANSDTIIDIENVVGSDGFVDHLYGDDGANRLAGLGGNDTLQGRGGDDVLVGGAGDDAIDGGDGVDDITGDDGADTITGGAGDDLIAGGAGNDIINADAGKDIVDGGAGADTIHGGADNDQILGGDDNDMLYGDDGDDALQGGAGADHLYGGAGADTLAGAEDADILEGGAGDDSYVFDLTSGSDTIIDAEGVNAFAFKGASFDQMWLTRSGSDLKIGVIGAGTSVTVSGFFSAANASEKHTITAGQYTLYLAHAGDLITQMTSLSATPPTAMPTDVASALATYWYLDGNAAPLAADQTLTTDEDHALTGSVGAVDHNDETMSYAVSTGPQHGGLVLNATTGAWTYTPQSQWSGADTFDLDVTDASGNLVTQTVNVTVAPVNDAPTINTTSFAINENLATNSLVGTLTTTDIEGQAVTFTQQSNAGGRFAVSSAGQITVLDGAAIDFEASPSYQITVTTTDAGGASLGPQTITITLNDINEAPTALTLANAVASLAENTSTAERIKIADLVIADDALGTETLGLSDADAASFEIVGGALYLKAGVSLNYESKQSYAVTVTADDPTIGSSPDLSKSYTFSVTDVNEAPSALAFANTVTALAEATSTASRTKVADLVITDDALGSETLGLTGADAASFEIIGAALYLKAGVALDYETKSSYSVTVTVDDASIGSGVELSQTFVLGITDGNEAPTGLSFANAVTTISENASTASRTKIADIIVNDDALGTLVYGLAGADASSFEIIGTELFLKAGVALNYEAKASYAVTVTVDDPDIGTGPEQSQSLTLFLSDVNEAPTALTFSNTTTSLAENTSTASRIKVADLSYSDDALGSESYGLSGADAASFEIIGASLYLKAGVTLNYEAKSSYAVTVTVDDASVGASPDLSQAFTLSITDVNEAPTALTFANTTTTLAENTSTTSHIKVADIVVTDDALGTETLALTGADAASFEIVGSSLYLKAGVALNFEAKSSYAVTVTADDATVGSSPDVSQNFTLNVSDVNEAPTNVTFSNTTTSLAESASTSSHTKVADLSYSDDALGSESYGLSGADAASFEIVGSSLYLKAGVALNFEAKSSYAVTVGVDDASIAGNPDASQAFTLSITDVNEAPTGITFANATTSMAENTSTASHIKLADLVPTDDALGADTFSLAGTDAASFEIVGTALYLKAGVVLNYEAKTSYAVTVSVDDTTVGATPDATQGFTLSVANVNEAPYGSPSTRTTTFQYGVAANTLIDSASPVDPDGTTSFTYAIASAPAGHTYTINSSGQLKLMTTIDDGTYQIDNVVVSITDAGGLSGTQEFKIKYFYANRFLPIVLDLDGDGVELVSFATSTVQFDMDGDGTRDATGWVGPDDGFLVLDRNSDGVIDSGSEIAFAGDLTGAVSDIEGLRAYDTNDNGFFDGGDAQFASFQVWRDANQDGVSQASELQTLAQAGVVAINLTLTLTGASTENAGDNVIYGTTQYVRPDGALRDVGDVMLAFSSSAASGLPPIVFDLDGGGFALTGRLASNVLFDADNDGVTQRTGWFGAGEGVLALDRNGDGAITSGAEISFAQDLPGAQTDLEGLRAYDSNDNGFFDEGDARFAEFRIWQDANQDGVSQSEELRSLADWDIRAVNLTPTLTGASTQDARDNVLYATTQFVRTDGTLGSAGDVYLSYDDPNGLSADDTPAGGLQPSDPGTEDDHPDRQASNPGRKIHHPFNVKLAEKHNSDGLDWIFNHGEGADAAQSWRSGARDWLKDHLDQQSKRKHSIFDDVRNGVFSKLGHGGNGDDDDLIQDNGPMPPVASALHQGLGVADKRVLNMIDAMAGFGVRDGGDFNASSMRDPKVAQLLTSVPNFRHGQIHIQ